MGARGRVLLGVEGDFVGESPVPKRYMDPTTNLRLPISSLWLVKKKTSKMVKGKTDNSGDLYGVVQKKEL